jgi:hypothetical protein
VLNAAFPLDGVMVALVEGPGSPEQPEPMRPLGSDGTDWSLDIARPDPERDRLQLVAAANRVLYFGDVATKFTAFDPAQTAD